MTGPRADVYLDGALVASTAAEFAGQATTVLNGVKIDWGRSTAVDQPEPSSLGLAFVQNEGTADFLQSLQVGRRLDVTATGRIDTGAVANVMSQGDFEALAPGDVPANIHGNLSSLTVSTELAHAGQHSAKMVASSVASPAWAIFPPAPFSADVSAWDTIPRANEGEMWEAEAWLWALPGSSAEVQVVAFTDPSGTSYQNVGDPHLVPTGEGWIQAAFQVPITTSGRWLGLRVTVNNLGPTWLAMPGTWAEQAGTWLEQNRAFVDDLGLLAPAGGTDRTVLVFQGRVTDMSAKYLSGLAGGTTQVDVTAKDFTADLANTRVGDEPWLVEPLGDRVATILALAGGQVTAQVDASIAGTPVTYRDVDSQPAAGLITELAQSVAGVAWPAVHDPGGAYYWLEDPSNRSSLYVLHMGEDGQAQVGPNPDAPDAIKLTASNVLEEPIRWVQDVADVATRADITWLEQGTDDKGAPTTTERHHTLVDSGLEARLGQRGFSVSTQLISDADASRVATRLLNSQHSTEWHVSGLTWSIRYEETITAAEMVAALNLLDGTVRIGHSLVIESVPAWVPIAGQIVVYIEGGSYQFEDGSWILELVASATGQGQGVTWATVDPTWPWTAFENLAWVDVIGVAPAPIGE